MTYSKKFANYGIFTDGMLYKWFRDIDNALEAWESGFARAECAEEWLEEYDSIQLIDMKNGDILRSL